MVVVAVIVPAIDVPMPVPIRVAVPAEGNCDPRPVIVRIPVGIGGWVRNVRI
jgi:hypothetical protein